MPDDNQSVPGQQSKPEQNLCRDCVEWGPQCQCANENSSRYGGVVDAKAGACHLFKHV